MGQQRHVCRIWYHYRFGGMFGSGTLYAPLIGEFNAANLMLAFATLLLRF